MIEPNEFLTDQDRSYVASILSSATAESSYLSGRNEAFFYLFVDRVKLKNRQSDIKDFISDLPSSFPLDFTPSRGAKLYLVRAYLFRGQLQFSQSRLHYRLQNRFLHVTLPRQQRRPVAKPRSGYVPKYIPRYTKKFSVKSRRQSPEIYYRDFIRYRSGHPGSSSQSTVTYDVYRREWEGTVTPNFGAKLARELPINNYSLFMRQVRDSGYVDMSFYICSDPPSLFLESGPYRDILGTGYGGSSLGSAQHFNVDQLESRALNKIISKSGLQMTNLAQDFATYRQTVDLIADSAKRIALSLLALKKGNLSQASSQLFTAARPRRFGPGGAPSHTKSLANNWLALQYGWKPLLQDISESMELVSKFKSPSAPVFMVKASAKDKLVVTRRLAYNSDAPTCGRELRTTETYVTYMLRYKVADRLTQFLSQTGFTSPVNLGWELLPYSFVVDWFLPIGPYLETLNAFEGLEFVDGYKTKFTREEGSYRQSFEGPNFPGFETPCNIYVRKGSLSFFAVRHDREKFTSFPTPTFPQFKNPFSTAHALNGLALLRSAFR